MLRRSRPLLLLLLTFSALAQNGAPPVVYLKYDEAEAILEAMRDALPPQLRRVGPSQRPKAWPGWVKGRDQEIRARLVRGDEDSVVNLLLFGTSFTKLPRATGRELEQFAPGSSSEQALGGLIQQRADDLVKALATPGHNERLEFARQVVAKNGIKLNTPMGLARAREFLLDNLRRVLREQASYAEARDAARRLGDSTEEFAARSKIYQGRGLSLDTSLVPNLAIEQSLAALRERGLLEPGSVRRVAVVGPGLDFADKSGGFDFYPEQTIQPFAVMDSLLRLGLAKPDALEVTTLDISPRVNAHLQRARSRARQKMDYTIQLPRDPDIPWKPATLEYWERFGDQIGESAPAAELPPAATRLKIRAVRVPAKFVARVTPVDLNIILQHINSRGAERFDLIVATNVFVYYDTFEQSLGLANVERMLRPGGFLLTNNILLELPSTKVRSVHYLTIEYSDRADDNDHIVWYQLPAKE